jgi:hypothetical protein
LLFDVEISTRRMLVCLPLSGDEMAVMYR